MFMCDYTLVYQLFLSFLEVIFIWAGICYPAVIGVFGWRGEGGLWLVQSDHVTASLTPRFLPAQATTSDGAKPRREPYSLIICIINNQILTHTTISLNTTLNTSLHLVYLYKIAYTANFAWGELSCVRLVRLWRCKHCAAICNSWTP